MSRLPTPEELGEMLEAGRITREEAVEIMDRRAREQALRGMPEITSPPPGYTGPGPGTGEVNARSGGEDAAGTSGSARGRTEGAGGPETPEGRRARARGERRNDLIVEEWSGGGGGRRLGGDGREFWEYEQDSVGPGRELILTVALIVGGLLGLVALLVYGIVRLHQAFPEMP